MLRRSIPACLGLLSILMTSQAMAGISLSATRIIFDGNNKEANVTVRNGGKDVLIQSWVDNNDAKRSVPFSVTPPLVRVFAQGQQLLRVLYEGAGMPSDKESVIWLNVQEIPQAAPGANTLQLAVRQRIKIFFRPAGLTGNALIAPSELQWQLLRQGDTTSLQVINPTSYHVSMSDVKLEANDQIELAADSAMVAPGEIMTFRVKKPITGNNVRLSFGSINDYGAQNHYTTTLASGQSTTATEAPRKF